MHRLIERFPLHRGAHPTRDDGMCAMEMVAWLAGEPHSDEPRCSCPVVAAFVRACNDVMPDSGRNRYLRPLVPVLVNTRSTVAVERQRGFIVLDRLLRRLVPAWLRRQHRPRPAAEFEQLGPIVNAGSLQRAERALQECDVDLHPARWVVQRAREGMPPARFVAGAVQVARALGDEQAWLVIAEAIEAMTLAQPARVENPVLPDLTAD